MKKLTAILCGLSIICSMTGCTKKETEPEKAPIVPVVTQTMYKAEEMSVPADFGSLISLDYSAAKGTALIYQNKDMGYSVQYYDENLNETENYLLSEGDISYSCMTFMTQDGTIHLLIRSAEYDGDPTEDYEKFYEEAIPRLEIYSFTPEGEKSGFLTVEELPQSLNLTNSITDLLYYNGNYIVSTFEKTYIIDKNGIVTEKEMGMDVSYAIDTEGRLVASKWEDYCYTDESLKYSETPTKYGEYIRRTGKLFTGTGDYSLFGVMQQGIYGMTADGQLVKLLDFVSSRVVPTEVYAVSYVGEGKFAAYTTSNDGIRSLVLLTVRPDDYVVNREKVILAVDGIDSGADSYAGNFNKSSDEYEIEVRHYEHGSDDLRADVLSDSSPDIYYYMDLDTVQSYTNIGAFADMYELMDKYGGLSREDIMPNVLEAYETGGKLYFMSDKFYANCNVAWSEVLGKEYSNWTMDKFLEVVENMPEDMYIGDKWSFDSRHGLFSYLCQDNVEQWVDFDNNTCDFNSESFIKTLELCRDLKIVHEEIPDYENMTEEEMLALEEWNAVLLKNKEALIGWGGGSMSTYSVMMFAQLYGLGIKDVTLIANPTKNGGGTINGQNYYSVLSSGNCTEGGWAYMCWLLSQKQQEQVSYYLFPVRKESFYKCTEKFKQQENEYNKGSSNVNGYSYEYDLMGINEQYDYIVGFIEKCNSLGGFRSKVREILDDEYKSFAAGEVTAEECAKRIQSRMEIYLSENS